MNKTNLNERIFITPEKELIDSLMLIDQLRDDGFVKYGTILVNIGPDFSSRLTQLINHKLSHLNNNQLFEVLNLEIPDKNMNQVWNHEDGEWQLFDKYVYWWTNKYYETQLDYLFITPCIFSGKSIAKVRHIMNNRLNGSARAMSNYRIASVYTMENSITQPDYKIRDCKLAPLFFWENSNLK